jgi:SulP family sulfate permease
MRTARDMFRRARGHLRQVLGAVDWVPWRRTLQGYDRARGRADLMAGLNGALVAFPQAVACAAIAGLPLTHGLFASAIATTMGALFSRSRFVVMGPTNTTAVLLLSAFLASGIADEAARPAVVALLVLMTGALQVAAAYLNIGSLVAYVSRSVIVGYISAAVVLIIANQAGNLLGVEVADAATLYGMARAIAAEIATPHWPTVGVAGATAAVYLVLKRFTPRAPNIAITLAVSAAFGLVATRFGLQIDVLQSVHAAGWTLTWPDLDAGLLSRLANASVALAFLGVLESSSIGKLLAARAGDRFNTNQEIFALGMANIGCAIGGGMPASGSPTRSMLNYASGAATPAASIICGLLTVVLVFVLGPWMDAIPKSSLAALVVLTAVGLFNVRQIRFVVRSTPGDAAVFAATAVSALVFPLDFAVFVGTATSIVFFLRKAGEPELAEYAFNPEGQLTEIGRADRRPLPEISIVHVEGSLFFGAAELMQEQIRRACEDANLKIIILRLKHAHHLDASSILALEELVDFMRENGRGLIVSGARKDVVRICKRTGLLDLIGRENFFPEFPQNPTVSTRNALRRAQEILGQKEADVRVFSEMRTTRDPKK